MSGAMIMVAVIYMLPAIVAGARGSKRRGGITVLNVLLGWTLIGWVVALVWAMES